MITAVLFDLDETLHDRSASLRDFLISQHERHLAGCCSLEMFMECFVRLDAHGSLPKTSLYPRLLSELGVTNVNALMLAEDYAAQFHQYARHMDGAMPLLHALRQQGMKLAIITNGSTGFQLSVSAALRFTEFVDLVMVSEAEGSRKPDPRIFLLAAGRLETPPSACLFVGDNPEADVQGANAVGMHAVWFRRSIAWPPTLAPVGKAIDELGQVLELLAS
jgi:putative hydrolase of the HAD superfamily